MEKTLKNFIIGLVYVIPFIALVVPTDMFFPFITGRAFLFRIAIDVAFGLYLGLAIADKNYWPKNNPLVWSVGALTLIALVADILSPFPFKAFWSNFERMEGFVTIAHLAVFFLVSSSVLKSKDWKRFFFVSFSVAVFMAFYSGLQMAHEIPIDQGNIRIDGLLGNAAYLAIFFAFHAFIALVFMLEGSGKKLKGIAESVSYGAVMFFFYYIYKISALKMHPTNIGWVLLALSIVIPVVLLLLRYFDFTEKHLKEKIEKISAVSVYLILFAVFSYLVFETQTRGTTLGLIGGIIVASIYVLIREKTDKVARIASIILLAGAVALIGGFLSIKNTSFVQNNPTLQRFATISWNQGSGQARQMIWPVALKGIKEKPILGWGQDGFIYIFSKYYDPGLYGQEPWFDRAHNEFLDWAVAGGALGFLAYLSLFISSLWITVRSKKFSEVSKALIIGLIAAYGFHNLFVFDNLISYILFFSLLGFIVGSGTPEIEDAGKKDKNKIIEILKMSAPFGLIAGVALAIVINYAPYQQNITLIHALTTIPPQKGVPYSCTDVYQKVGVNGEISAICRDAEPTVDVFKKALAFGALGETETRQFLIQTANTINADKNVSYQAKVDITELIMSEYEKQLKENPMFVTSYFDYGGYLSGIGLLDQAKQVFLKASELSPTRQFPYMKLGEIAVNQNDIPSAINYFKKAYDLDHSYTEAEALYAIGLLKGNKLPEAEEIMNDLVSNGKGLPQNIIKILVERGNINYARTLLTNRIASNPEDKNAQTSLASLSQIK
ncbi:MAG: O-antigen ligase family protein [Candidatus Paceibacterota bacterium]